MFKCILLFLSSVSSQKKPDKTVNTINIVIWYDKNTRHQNARLFLIKHSNFCCHILIILISTFGLYMYKGIEQIEIALNLCVNKDLIRSVPILGHVYFTFISKIFKVHSVNGERSMGNSQAIYPYIYGYSQVNITLNFRKNKKEGLRNCRPVRIPSFLGRFLRNFSCKYVRRRKIRK